MATKKSKPEPVGQPQVGPKEGKQLLERLVEKGNALLAKQSISSDERGEWELLARNYLEKAFGTNSPNVSNVIGVGKLGFFPMDVDESWWQNERRETLTTQLSRLNGLIEVLQTEAELQGEVTPAASAPVHGHRIFLVHGHNERVLHECARFLEKLDQDVIVLREQPSEGRTIIEKFETYADVGFAVVLLTGDDVGGAAGAENQHPRARQNVIFELGYFIGKLGRNRVCALYQPGVEIPSDYSGVLYQSLDDNGMWKIQLARELKAAGFPVDMNRAF